MEIKINGKEYDIEEVKAMLAEIEISKGVDAGIEIGSLVIDGAVFTGTQLMLKKLCEIAVPDQAKLPVKIALTTARVMLGFSLGTLTSTHLQHVKNFTRGGIKAAKLFKKLKEEANGDGRTEEPAE